MSAAVRADSPIPNAAATAFLVAERVRKRDKRGLSHWKGVKINFLGDHFEPTG